MSASGDQVVARRVAAELIPFEPVPDSLMLAAIQRAALHSQRDSANIIGIASHLGFERTLRTSLHLKRQLAALADEDMVQRGRVHGVLSWQLTSKGHAQLGRARRAG